MFSHSFVARLRLALPDLSNSITSNNNIFADAVKMERHIWQHGESKFAFIFNTLIMLMESSHMSCDWFRKDGKSTCCHRAKRNAETSVTSMSPSLFTDPAAALLGVNNKFCCLQIMMAQTAKWLLLLPRFVSSQVGRFHCTTKMQSSSSEAGLEAKHWVIEGTEPIRLRRITKAITCNMFSSFRFVSKSFVCVL